MKRRKNAGSSLNRHPDGHYNLIDPKYKTIHFINSRQSLREYRTVIGVIFKKHQLFQKMLSRLRHHFPATLNEYAQINRHDRPF
ncbi:hypothetical protein ACI0FR_00877 [Paenochrobactrum sp. BZR 201-1]